MADSFSQIHLQFVFAVKFRKGMIQTTWKEHLHKYITGIIQHNQHKMLQINSMPDHIHMLFGYRPHQTIQSLIQNIKTESTKWIKKNYSHDFAWQQGYGAFSYSKWDVPKLIAYIRNQEEHHKKETFLEEYSRLLKDFEIAFDERYIFKPME